MCSRKTNLLYKLCIRIQFNNEQIVERIRGTEFDEWTLNNGIAFAELACISNEIWFHEVKLCVDEKPSIQCLTEPLSMTQWCRQRWNSKTRTIYSSLITVKSMMLLSVCILWICKHCLLYATMFQWKSAEMSLGQNKMQMNNIIFPVQRKVNKNALFAPAGCG